MQLYRLDITSPKKGRKAALVRSFIVMAPNEAAVLDVFDRDQGAHHREGDSVKVELWGTDLAPLSSSLQR